MRQLQQGEVGVSFFPNGVRDILPESNFVLVDRSFQPGDLCKRSIDDVHSGVVTSVEVKARLAHAISDEPVEGWKSVDQFERSTMAEVGDYVLCDDWVGQVRPHLDFL
jgi:ubiquitin-conjugating enzyme E2 O